MPPTRRSARPMPSRRIVLLKNDGNLLPLRPNVRSIAIIGGHADKGVLAGSGSSLVYPRGGNAVPGLQPTGWPGPVMYYPVLADGRDPRAGAQRVGHVRRRHDPGRSGARPQGRRRRHRLRDPMDRAN